MYKYSAPKVDHEIPTAQRLFAVLKVETPIGDTFRFCDRHVITDRKMRNNQPDIVVVYKRVNSSFLVDIIITLK